jgi:hypothetical protein
LLSSKVLSKAAAPAAKAALLAIGMPLQNSKWAYRAKYHITPLSKPEGMACVLQLQLTNIHARFELCSCTYESSL